MELDKKKYKKEEVETLLAQQKFDYEEKIAQLKARVLELIDSENHLKSEVASFKKNEGKILRASENAQEISIQLQKKAHEQYVLTIEKLKRFSVKWKEYFDFLKEKYPMYPTVQNAIELKEKMDKLLGKSVAEKTVGQIDNILRKETGKFDPKSKIEQYISATSDNGFDINEVLNPGELQLEDLCRELGLIEK